MTYCSQPAIDPTRRAALALLLACACAMPAAAVAEDAAPPPAEASGTWVIPPAQEAVLGALLDPSELAEGVRLDSGRIAQTRIAVVYRADDGATWRFWLGHPEAAPPAEGGPWKTELAGPFALHLPRDGATPPWAAALLAGLRDRLVDGAGAWRWQRLQTEPRASDKPGKAEEDKAQAATDALLVARHAAMAGNAEHTRQRLADAEAALDRLPEADHRAWHHLEAALVARATQNKVAAERHGLRALKLAGDDPRHEALRARALLAMGRDDEALAGLPGTDKGPDCSAALAVEDFRMVGDNDRATALARKITSAHPRCARAYIAAAQVARKTGTLAAVEDLLQAGAAALPEDGAVLVQLANLRMAQNRHADALKLLDRAARTEGLDPSFLVDISHVYTTIEPPDEDVNRWLKRAEDDNDHSANFIAGVLLHYRYRWADSDRHLARAEPTFGNETRLLIYRAMNRHRLGDRDAALKLIERASGGARPDPDVLYCRGVIGLDVDTERAIADLEAYLDQTRQSHEVYLPKQKRVEQMLADLRDCRGAKVPSECLQTRKTLRQSAPWGTAAAGLFGVLLVAFLLWRRRRIAVVLLAALPVWLWSEPAAAAHPRALIAQWSWLGDLERLQVVIAAALWLVALAFFFAAWRWCAAPGHRWARSNDARP